MTRAAECHTLTAARGGKARETVAARAGQLTQWRVAVRRHTSFFGLMRGAGRFGTLRQDSRNWTMDQETRKQAMVIEKYRLSQSLLLGQPTIKYMCPRCSESLKSKLDEAGQIDKCPACSTSFVVPGSGEKRRREEEVRQHVLKQVESDTKRRGNWIIMSRKRDSIEARAASERYVPPYSIARFVVIVCYGFAALLFMASLVIFFNWTTSGQDVPVLAILPIVGSLFASAIAFALAAEVLNMIRDMAINSWHSRHHLDHISNGATGNSD